MSPVEKSFTARSWFRNRVENTYAHATTARPWREQLYQEAFMSADFEPIFQLKAIGLAGDEGSKKAASEAVDKLFEKAYIRKNAINGKSLELTEKGSAEIKRAKQMPAWIRL